MSEHIFSAGWACAALLIPSVASPQEIVQSAEIEGEEAQTQTLARAPRTGSPAIKRGFEKGVPTNTSLQPNLNVMFTSLEG